jgi:ketosteroid isomerase-like protein
VNDNAQLLERFFDAFATGRFDVIEASLADDVRSHTPGHSRLAGTREGRDAVLAHLGRSRELSDGTYRIEIEDLLGGEHHAAVVYRGTASRLGRELDLRHVALYAIEDGRVTEIWFTPLDQDVFDAFWS